MKPLSKVAPGLLVIQIPIQAVWLFIRSLEMKKKSSLEIFQKNGKIKRNNQIQMEESEIINYFDVNNSKLEVRHPQLMR